MSLQEYYHVYFETEQNKQPLICVVCGGLARGFNFGAITCMSCKMFFHRNALMNMNKLRCLREENCQIDTRTRKYCSYCRLRMCFRVGMRKELIRTNQQCSKCIDDLNQQMQITHRKAIRPLDLLQWSDRSLLSNNDWILLRQLSSIFDSHTDRIALKAHQIHDEIVLLGIQPLKMRVKATYLYDIAETFASAVLEFVQFVPQFVTLPSLNKQALMTRNTRAVIMFFTHYQINLRSIQKLCQTPYWIASLNCVHSPSATERHHKLNYQVGQLSFLDPCLIKLIVVLLAFCTNNIDHDEKTIARHLNEYYHAFLLYQIQSIYVELMWKYMIYRFGEERTIHFYSKLIQTILQVQRHVSAMDNSEVSSEQKFDEIMAKLTGETRRIELEDDIM